MDRYCGRVYSPLEEPFTHLQQHCPCWVVGKELLWQLFLSLLENAFGDLTGLIFIISKARYGLRSNGLRWHKRFANTLRDMAFIPSKANSDAWMCLSQGVDKYIAVYIDTIAVAAHDLNTIVKQLKNVHKYKLKGIGPLEYHLGCTFKQDKDGTLSCHPRKYIAQKMEYYKCMYGNPPKQYVSLLDKGNHPELEPPPS
jgi:hypothetical protein